MIMWDRTIQLVGIIKFFNAVMNIDDSDAIVQNISKITYCLVERITTSSSQAANSNT